MAITSTHQVPIEHRPFERRFVLGVATAIAVLVGTIGLVVYRSNTTSTPDFDRTQFAPALDVSRGPNADLPHVGGIEQSPVEAANNDSLSLGPNADLPHVQG